MDEVPGGPRYFFLPGLLNWPSRFSVPLSPEADPVVRAATGRASKPPRSADDGPRALKHRSCDLAFDPDRRRVDVTM